jgi:hypothetical protein
LVNTILQAGKAALGGSGMKQTARAEGWTQLHRRSPVAILKGRKIALPIRGYRGGIAFVVAVQPFDERQIDATG